MKSTRLLLLSPFLILHALTSGPAQAQQALKTEIRVGFVPGPYIDEFKFCDGFTLPDYLK